MAKQQLTFQFEDTGIDAVNRDLTKTQQNLKQTGVAAQEMSRNTGAATRQVAQSTRAATQATNQLASAADTAAVTTQVASQKYGAFAGVLGNVGTIAASATPAFSKMAGAFGSARAATTTAASAFGPWGLAIGAATTALALLIPTLTEAQEGLEDTGTAAEEAAAKMQDYISRVDAAATSTRNFIRTQRIQLGQFASAEEAEAAVIATSQLLAESQDNLQTIVEESGHSFNDASEARRRLNLIMEDAVLTNRHLSDAEVYATTAIRGEVGGIEDAVTAINREIDARRDLNRQLRTQSEARDRLRAQEQAERTRTTVGESDAAARAAAEEAARLAEQRARSGAAAAAALRATLARISDDINKINERQYIFTDRIQQNLEDITAEFSTLQNLTTTFAEQGAEGIGGFADLFIIDEETTQASIENTNRIREGMQAIADLQGRLLEQRTALEGVHSEREAEIIRTNIENIEEELDSMRSSVSIEIALLEDRTHSFAEASDAIEASLQKEQDAFAANAENERRITQMAIAARDRELEEEQKRLEQASAAFANASLSNLDDVIAKYNELIAITGEAANASEVAAFSIGSAFTTMGQNIESSFRGSVAAAFDEFVDSQWEAQRAAEEAANNTSTALGETSDSAEVTAVTLSESVEAIGRSIIQALVSEAIVQTVVEGARALASAASFDYVGAAAHGAAAATWASVGTVAGGALALMGPGPRAGGVRASRPSEAAAPEQQQEQKAGDRTVQIIFEGQVLATRDDIGRMVHQSLREAERVGAL